MNILIGVGLITLVVTALVWSVVSLSRDAQRIHGRLREYRARAEKASSSQELLEIRRELVTFHREACFHRHFSEHAARVIAYIDGRLDAGGAS